ncbi:MAG: hypothetical protein EPN21_04755 [Methylococcaceae bacterium]|nr:MAG: hypothetical protein EPN21_04755 [Methylococcaceae bacterium]
MIKKILAIAVGVSLSSNVMAGAYGKITVLRVFKNGYAYFGQELQPPDTCSNFEAYFKFSPTGDYGKNMLSMLIAAKTNGAPVTVWYTKSPVPGTTETSGCNTDSNTSTATGVSLD